ncbi:hypothetical protein KCP70_19970 [Salmonella enterica subsp. enterica]|nr:hypothetical protein KCP70_19970 [Salmonella enterica subsp. enterica]
MSKGLNPTRAIGHIKVDAVAAYRVVVVVVAGWRRAVLSGLRVYVFCRPDKRAPSEGEIEDAGNL